MSLPDLPDTHRELLSDLPATANELAETFSLSPSGVRSRINRIREKLEDSDADAALKHDGEAYYLAGEDTTNIRRLSTQAKSTKTRRANEYRTEVEAAILRRLKRRGALEDYHSPDPGSEDMALAFGDVHMGDVVRSNGRDVYNPQIAYASILELTRKALEIRDKDGELFDIDNIHLFWLGDMVTGEQIYNRQGYNIRALMADQLTMAVEALTTQVTTLAEEFEHVTVTAVPGNHGLDHASSKSQQANQDLNAYRWTVDRLIDRGIDNVDFRISQGGHYVNREVRGHRYHIRHGQDEQVHADATARSQADQRGILHSHDFDVQIRGHWHTKREEEVLSSADVITLPSPKPGGDFAERIGRPDISARRRLGQLWRLDDKRPITASYTIDDLDMDLDDLDAPTLNEMRGRYNDPGKGPHDPGAIESD